MDLNGRQRQQLRQALMDAFGFNALKILVSDYLDTQLDTIVLDGGLEHRVQELLLWADQEDRLLELVAAACERRPRNRELATLAEELGLSSAGGRIEQPLALDVEQLSHAAPGSWIDPAQIPPSLRTVAAAGGLQRIELQRVVNELGSWVHVAEFAEKLIERERQVCKVVLPRSSGTGFLVGPDLVLTNFHVVEKVKENHVSRQDVHCLFDYRELSDGTPVGKERRAGLADKWLVDWSLPSPSDETVGGPDPTDQECDYALLRLSEKVGEQAVGPSTTDADAPHRGWIPVVKPPPPAARGREVFLLQHPKGKPVVFTIGRVLGFNDAGNRLRHDANTKRGSSGSPCLNADMALIALHHAGDPDYDSEHRPTYNQAVPMAPILKRLEANQTPQFWTSE